jgi:hypothetical protein
MCFVMTDLLHHWDNPTPLLPFDNPFANGGRSVPQRLIVESPNRIAYGPIGDLETFFSSCRSVRNWESGHFPPLGYTDPLFGQAGVSQFVIPGSTIGLLEWKRKISMLYWEIQESGNLFSVSISWCEWLLRIGRIFTTVTTFFSLGEQNQNLADSPQCILL